MKYLPTVIQRELPAIALLLAGGLAGIGIGCSQPRTQASAPGTPPLQGSVQATKDTDGNTSLSIRVLHLASPSAIASDAKVFVAWILPPGGYKHNIGPLILNDRLEGSLDTVTPHRRFHVFVTPEPDARSEQPTHPSVFSSEVERPE